MERWLCVVLPMFVIALVGVSALSAQTWEYGYECEKIADDPALGDDAWGVYKTDGTNSSDICEITGAKELHMDDPADKVCFFLRELDEVPLGTIEARVKILEQGGATYTILMGIENGDAAWLDLFPDHIQIEGGASYSVDMTEYHVLRLTRDDTDIVVYVDGEQVLEGAPTASSDKRVGMIFGSGSTGGTGEHYWDYVAYTTSGAYPPDELEDYLSSLAVESEGKLATCWGNIKFR